MTWIRIEPAIVYRAAGEGRRYLTRSAAYKHAAKALIAARRECRCEPPLIEGVEVPFGYEVPMPKTWERCPLHDWPELEARVARLMERDDERRGR